MGVLDRSHSVQNPPSVSPKTTVRLPDGTSGLRAGDSSHTTIGTVSLSRSAKGLPEGPICYGYDGVSLVRRDKPVLISPFPKSVTVRVRVSCS